MGKRETVIPGYLIQSLLWDQMTYYEGVLENMVLYNQDYNMLINGGHHFIDLLCTNHCYRHFTFIFLLIFLKPAMEALLPLFYS